MVSFETSDLNKIGKGLTGFGIIFILVGLVLFFDKSFLAIGNILLLIGVILTVGLNATLEFFLKPQTYKGTIPLVVGFFFVIKGWPVIGMLLETCGFIFLLRGFWPMVANFLQKLPILGLLLRRPHEYKYNARLSGRRVPV